MTEGHVYRISAPNSNSVYVGQTINPRRRWRYHRWEATKGTHNNPALQNFLRKHSDAVFYSWPVFDMCEAEKAEERLCRDMGFQLLNIAACGEVSPTLGRKASLETRSKLSLARMGNQNARGTTHTVSVEGRANMARAKLGNSYNKGRRHSAETREKIRIKAVGRRHSTETCEKIRKSRTGVKTRPHTTETREKMRQAALRREERKRHARIAMGQR